MTEHNHSVKSQLAKLLAMENITVQHKAGIKTAMFDVKARVLYLPLWRQMSEDLYDLLVVHEVGHALDTPKGDAWVEDMKAIAQRVVGNVSNRSVLAVKGFLNVVEDCRIDKRQKRRYPGSRRNYLKGYAELFENNFFGTKNRDINKLTFIDRINIHFKVGVMAGVKFTRTEQEYVDRIADAETWEEVLKLTEELFKRAKDTKDEPQPDPEQEDDEGSEDYSEWDTEASESESGEAEESESGDDGEEGDEEDSESGEGSDGEEEDSEDGEGESEDGDTGESSDEEEEGSSGEDGESENDEDADGDDADSEDDEDGEDSSESGEGDIEDTSAGRNSEDPGREDEDEENDYLPESATDQAWEEKANDLLDQSDTIYQYINLPEPNLKYIVDDYKVVLGEMKAEIHQKRGSDWIATNFANMTKWRNEENKTISFLVKEFETRKAADTYSKVMIAKTGVINTNKLHSYKYNDDIFRRNTVLPQGKNHGFVMLLDWSGSMSGNLLNTLKQLFTMALFCRRVQIPFEVYSFRDETFAESGHHGYILPPHDHFNPTTRSWTYRQNSAVIGDFKLRNILSSRMNAAEFNQMMGYLWMTYNFSYDCDPLSGTPLNEALIAFTKVVEDFKRRTKVQIVNTIVLTDGEGMNFREVHGDTALKSYTSRRSVQFILEDSEMKKNWELGKVREFFGLKGIDGKTITRVLLQRLKERTGANVVGFYLTTSPFKYAFPEHFKRYTTEEFKKEMKRSWDEDGFFPVIDAGYDKYFILSSEKIADRRHNLVVDTAMTNNRLAKEFGKFSSARNKKKVLLRQFIAEIAS